MSLELLSPHALLARPRPEMDVLSRLPPPPEKKPAPPQKPAPRDSRLTASTSLPRTVVAIRPPPQIPQPFGRAHTASCPSLLVTRSFNSIDFDKVCMDASFTINPRALGFVPSSAWSSDPISFGVLVATFFRRRNSANCKFHHKLFNALRLTQAFPELLPHVGVEWATEKVFRVHRNAFARLLGLRTVDGSLFHQQGNFPSHGFVELPFTESDQISRAAGFGPADLSEVRFVMHSAGIFRMQCTEADLELCKWSGH